MTLWGQSPEASRLLYFATNHTSFFSGMKESSYFIPDAHYHIYAAESMKNAKPSLLL